MVGPTFVFLLFLASQQFAEACHVYEAKPSVVKAVNGRRKREAVTLNQLNFEYNEVESTAHLRLYFGDCLVDTFGRRLHWKSVVDFSVLDTRWYKVTNDKICRSNDTAACWMERVYAYIPENIFLQEAVAICIQQFSVDVSEGLSTPRDRRERRSARREGGKAESVKVKKYTDCQESEIKLQPGRKPLHFPSIVQFVAESTGCRRKPTRGQTRPSKDWIHLEPSRKTNESKRKSKRAKSPAYNGCGPVGKEMLSVGDNVPSWPYRLQSLVKLSSPLRASTAACNARVFPLPPTYPPTHHRSEVCYGLDIAIVIDTSKNIFRDHFRRVKKFVRSFLSQISSGLNHRVASVRFSAFPETLWHLEPLTNVTDMISVINKLDRDVNGTKVMKALWWVKKQLFVPLGGDREEAPNMIILVTDGVSEDDVAHKASRFRRAARARVIVVPVSRYDVRNINLLASEPKIDNIFRPEDVEHVVYLINRISEYSCE